MSGTAAGDLVGQVLDSRYRIEAFLGRGGMGAVYRARHQLLDRAVALKILLPELATDQLAARRFVREARGTFKLDHPHCVRVSDFGATADGILYLVMEYLDGRTVQRELAVDGPMEASRVAHILAQTASALGHAHDKGLVHRDLKGENIMLLSRDGDVDYVKVLDFGLAKMWDADGGGLSLVMSVAALTQDGITFGTPQYMSPEQALGEPLTPASDIYSLAVCGYEMLTGLLPFHDDNPVQLLSRIIRDPLPPPSSRRYGIDPELESFLLRCLDKDGARRPGPAPAVAEILEDHARRLSRPAPSRSSGMAASETVQLLPDGPPGPQVRSPRAGFENDPGPGAETRAVIQAGVKRSWRGPLLLAGAIGVAAVIALALFGGNRGGGGEPAAAAPTSHDAAPPDPPAPAAAPDPPDAGPAQDAAASRDAAAPGAGPKSGGRADPAQPAADRREPPTIGPARRRARDLVRQARAAASPFDRLVKAGAAVRADPTYLEARYLHGDALIDNGKLDEGCRELRRARRHPRARRRYRNAGCSGD